MATTTNYGWTTPDDTALVKDGASAIRSLGTAIDTTTKNLNPSTTLGDLEYRSSTSNTNSRLGIGTSGQGLQVVAGVPAWAASSTSTLTTTGDLLYASAANTLARRAIGSTGDVLTVSGGLPTWAAPAASGAYTSLATGTLSTAEVSITSISSAYTDLYLIVNNPYVNSASPLAFRVNNNSTNDYCFTHMECQATTIVNTTNVTYLRPGNGNLPTSTSSHFYYLYIRSYANSLTKTYILGGADASNQNWFTIGAKTLTAAISSIQIRTQAGTPTFSGGTYTLYGVK
jgi:hypothetical protein